MCSINEDDLDVLLEIDTGSAPLSDVCKKCSSNGTVVLRKKDVYCVSCFTAAVNHKFRASLGKNKTVRANQRVLLAVSGGRASSVLLNFVHNGLSEDTHKKLRVEAMCIYICDTLESDTESCIKKYKFVLEQCKQYNLPLYITHLSSVLDKESSVSEPNTIPSTNLILDEKLKSLMNSLSSETSRRDLLIKLRRSLLVRCAGQFRCDFILTGEISTSLASTMLSNVSLGRGAQIEDDIGFSDSRDSIKILKPIKDLTFEEVNIYMDLKNICHLDDEAVNEKHCIQSTIEKFVADLQENFPATISTICKTGEKMGGCGDAARQADKCVVCQSALDTQVSKSSALQATEFSRLVSSTGPHHVPGPASAAATSCANCTKKQLSREEIEKFLCYGCRLILRDVQNNDLPTYFTDAVTTTIAMEKLRIEINDFLL